MAERKTAARKQRTPRQTTFVKPAPQVKNGDILDVDEAAVLLKVSKKTIYNRVKAGTLPHAKLGRKLLFSRQKLQQWVADGGDRIGMQDSDQLSLDDLPGMLNSGKARVSSKR